MSAPQSPDLLATTAVDPTRGSALKKVAFLLVIVGAVLTALALTNDAYRARASFGYLMGYAFVWSIVLGSVFFVALQHVTRSVWSVTSRRVAEMFAAPMGIMALLFLPIVFFALRYDDFPVFPWMNADQVANDPTGLLQKKAPYLDQNFFFVRTALFFLIWGAFAGFFVRQSLKQDDGQVGASATLRMRKLSAPFLVLFAFTVTFASFDWLMSLEPHWFSTIYGVYVFSGMVLASLAAITIGVVWLRAKGWLAADLVRPDHLYSLGALLFAFTCWWAYIAFSQYMLIWYANLPEETIWFVHRQEHGWMGVTVFLAVLRFVIPFFLLLGRDAKSDPKRLVIASVLLLAGQLLDLYWLIMPQLHEGGPRLGWPELAPTILLTGILIVLVARFLGRHRLTPVGDPLFEKSRHFHL